MRATTRKSCWVHVDLVFKYLMWMINVSFLLNITPRNVYSSTTGISVSSSLMTGSLCIFIRQQKYTHWVLDLENLKPLSEAHLFILMRFYCSCRSTRFMWVAR